MLAAGKRLGSALALLGVALVGGVGAGAATPSGWTADPEKQFLLDVDLRRLRLGDGVRAYTTPEGTCVIFGDFLTALDVPMKIDLAAKKASGWAFKEEHRIVIDAEAGSVTYGQTTEPLAAGAVRETPDGWCIDTAALARWFGIGIKPLTNASALVLESEAKLPVELAIERKQRAASLKPAKFDLSTLPQVKLPYRMWRTPALDFVVNAGVTYNAHSGTRVDRRTAIYAAGEIATLSYDAQLATDEKGIPASLRMRAYRSSPEGGMLGPLNATHFAIGDVVGLDSPLSGSAVSGRGALVTNRPVVQPTAFDRTHFEGDLPLGWEAELYRNGELVAFAHPADQRYSFDDIQLFYGENQISVVMYGPQGQIRTREETINVGQDNVPAGKTWYWAGFNQPSRDLVTLNKPPDIVDIPNMQASASLEHGIDDRTSVGALARMMLIDDQRVTFVEGSVRRSIGTALVEVAAARANNGGTAARAQMVGRFGSVNVSGEALIARNFILSGRRENTARDVRLNIDAPVKIGRLVIPAHADVRYVRLTDGVSELEAATRLSANINRFNLATDFRYTRQYLAHGPAPPGELTAEMIGSGRVGDVRLRGSLVAETLPQTRFRSAELSAYWSASDRVDWEGAVAYDADVHRARARISHIRRLSTMALTLTGEAATDGSVAVGLNLNFSLDPIHGVTLSRQPLAGAGAIRARVYRDLNDNGVRDTAEPFEKGALITTGTRIADHATDDKGSVLVGGLNTYAPIAVGVDATSLADPTLVPKKALQVVVPRPGVPADVEIGLVGGGSIEGIIVKNGGLGVEGLTLELVDANGKVAMKAQSDFDGFFLFDRVPYGKYRVRLSADTAEATKLIADLNIFARVSDEKPVVRLGTIEAQPLPRMASADQ